MKAVIVNFRKSVHRQKDNHMILAVEGIDSKEKAEALVGKTVSWKSPANREIKGKVASAHGNSGAVRVIFEKGMPGQAVGAQVMIS
ncbi:50S ribosomal protein L35ae [Nanoarchaeota archaeon]